MAAKQARESIAPRFIQKTRLVMCVRCTQQVDGDFTLVLYVLYTSKRQGPPSEAVSTLLQYGEVTGDAAAAKQAGEHLLYSP